MTPPAPVAAGLIRTGRFVLATLVCLLLCEIGLRRYSPMVFFWESFYRSPSVVTALFVGTSRTAAAVDADTFRACLPSPDVTVINAGSAYVTPVEIYFALRATLEDHPETLRDTVLFVEAPGEMPDPQRWSDPWPHPERPDVLTPLLRREDIGGYWRTSAPLKEKIGLSARYALRPSVVISRHLIIGSRMFDRLRSLIASALGSFVGGGEPPAPQADLTSAGGIRTDAEGVLAARRVAEDQARTAIRAQQPVDWPATVVADIVALAERHHVTVVFFAPPLHPVTRSIYETTQRRLDREHFVSFAAQRNLAVLLPGFPTAENDFPDILHLRKSLAPGYTRALCESYGRTRAPAPRPRQ